MSAEHAVIAWSAGQWSVRDLGSRNGSVVDARPLAAGERVLLAQGARVQIADPEFTWELLDARGPTAHARPVDGGPVLAADGDVLALPDDEDVEVTVWLSAEGRWVAEASGGGVTPVDDLDLVEAGGRSWRLHLPQRLEPTAAALTAPRLCLEFVVAPDEESVEVVVVEPGRRTRLPPRSHHYTLLTLARERLRQGGAESERGWVSEEDLAGMLRIDRQTVKVQIHRARQELGRLGIAGAGQVVERRTGTGLMRIGTGALSVSVAG
ncbi:MAG: FHA domain-containing protein [Myxococcales bacterium]|nr:FHA domain-containing protein [Myxococcales bacterium]